MRELVGKRSALGGVRVRIAQGWHEEGREGVLVGIIHAKRTWAAVVFDDEEDPSLFKWEGLELAQ